jgi:hypothetical protein
VKRVYGPEWAVQTERMDTETLLARFVRELSVLDPVAVWACTAPI